MFAYELIYFWLNFSSEFPEFPLCLCEEADWCAYLFMHLSVVALHPLFKHGFATYSQPQVHVCTCTPEKPVTATFLIPNQLSGCKWVVWILQIAAESHHISVIHVYDTDGGGGGLQHNGEKNKQVSKVIEKISETETNVLIMRLAG